MSETPIEDFIREAAVWVEKDGQTYFEMVMSTVHELERRFTAERRRAEELENVLAQEVKESKKWFAKSQSRKEEIKTLEARLQEAEKKADEEMLRVKACEHIA